MKNNILNNKNLKNSPFSIPEDYFETNKVKLIEKISYNLSNPFKTPDDYFETNKIKLIENILSSPNTIIFDIPENYFENNSLLINNRILISSFIDKRKKIISIIKYIAAAAAITGITWTIYLYNHINIKHFDTPNKDCETIACLTKKDILFKIQNLDEDILEEAISDEDIGNHNLFTYPENRDTNYNDINEKF